MALYLDKKIIFFDGVCNLCNGFVLFVIKRNSNQSLIFASLQSKAGIDMINHFQLDTQLNTVIFIDNGLLYKKSTAALHITKYLSGAWPLLYVLIIFPIFIRDKIYDIVAKNRYKWFGKKDACMIPTPDLQSRFLL